MIDERTHRAIPLGVTLLIATLAALAALAVSGGPAAQAHGEPAVAAKGSVTGSEFALRQGMRSLWEDHVSWTRLAIISLTTDSPDTKATVARLLRNQSDIGNAIKPYYGAKAGTGLTQLLREHILIAADLVAAAKAGDKAKLNAALKTWYVNGRQIAAFMTKANPDAWPLSMTSSMMKRHLQLTTAEAAARIGGKWAADVAAYDKVHAEILEMATMLSSGIIAQFPGRF